MNSLKNVQSIMKVLKVLSKIGLVLYIIGTVLCLASGAVLIAMEANEDSTFGATIREALAAEYGIGLREICVSVFALAIGYAFSCYLEFSICRYFKNELEDGTPFTCRGADELRNLGIKTIIVSVISKICTTVVFGGIFRIRYSFALGIGMILLSVVFRYGAELEENRMPEEEIEPEIRN